MNSMDYIWNGKIHQCEIKDCQQQKSYPPSSLYCREHRCESPTCSAPRTLGKSFCKQCGCEKDGCPNVRKLLRYQYFHSFCMDHYCVRCSTGSRLDHSTTCNECTLLCHQIGNTCFESRMVDSMYCVGHTCHAPDCREYKYDDLHSYCISHRCTTMGCWNQRSKSELFCGDCLQQCVERGCHNFRPLHHRDVYYCDHHGCIECHAAPKYSFYERHQHMTSVYCKYHYKQSVESDHLLYELYKVRKMIEANAIVEAGGDLETFAHTIRQQEDHVPLPCIIMNESSSSPTTIQEEVWKHLLDHDFRDDMFMAFMENFPRRLEPFPATDSDITNIIKVLRRLVFKKNRELESVNTKNPIRYDWFVRRYFGGWLPCQSKKIPLICLENLFERQLVLNRNREAMYRLSTVITVHDRYGDHMYKMPERDYAWTIPVHVVNSFSISGKEDIWSEDMIRLEGLLNRNKNL
uniref:Uncharacterized protein n=1 Tax=viral metagenome TaxID=1070528 RepID=A0A6C0D1P7_9ZZZZ